MSVAVRWTTKKRADNHRPKFRPTNVDRIIGVERKIYDAFLSGVDEIPFDTSNEIIFGNINETEAYTNNLARLAPTADEISRHIFVAYMEGLHDGAQRVRDSVNKKLRQLNSNARLAGFTKKALDEIIWQPFPYPDIPPLSLFDQQPDNMAGKVYARLRSNQIIVAISDDINANIASLIADGFKEQQTFTTGRTVTGRTVDQTARRLYGILADAAPVPITGADYASFVAPYTNGLFPSWAEAVNRSMDNYANNLAKKKIPDREILRRTAEHGRRYANKLRRSRARMIARTEVAYAQNRGIYDSFLKAQQDGLFSGTAMKRWVVGPTDVCNVCSPMGGVRVPLNQSFDWGTGGGDYPPAHPNCRCTFDIEPDINTAPNFTGAGTPTDPYRYEFPDGYLSDTAQFGTNIAGTG